MRRLSEHVREQNWFAVGLDLVIVFLAVFDDLAKDLAQHVSILNTKLSSLRAYAPSIQQTIDLLDAK